MTKKKSNNDIYLSEDGKTIEDETKISNIFNSYFIEKIKKLKTGIPTHWKKDPSSNLLGSFLQRKPENMNLKKH